MYSPREKLRIFNDIPNEGAAVADLNLLQRVAPQHPKLSVFRLNPQRYAGDILFSLLDFSTREEIILNRRDAEKDDKVFITEDAGVFAGGVGDLSDAPVADAPVADAPVSDAPVADAPVASDAPVADAPVADAPVASDAPVADAPVADAPVASDAPVADAPVADAPVADAPVADAPVSDAPAKKKTQRANSTGKSKNTRSTQK